MPNIWRCVWCHAILPKTAERCWMCELIKDIRRTGTSDLSGTDDRMPRSSRSSKG